MTEYLVKYVLITNGEAIFNLKEDFKECDATDNLWLANYKTIEEAFNSAAEQMKMMAKTLQVHNINPDGTLVEPAAALPIPAVIWRGIVISLCFIGEFYSSDQEENTVNALAEKYAKDYGVDEINHYFEAHLSNLSPGQYICNWAYNPNADAEDDDGSQVIAGAIQIVPHTEGDNVIDIYETYAYLFE